MKTKTPEIYKKKKMILAADRTLQKGGERRLETRKTTVQDKALRGKPTERIN